jgi:hypothetical protein
MITVSSSPNLAISAATSGRRVRGSQRVIGKIRKLAEDLRLVDRAVDAPSELALFDPFGRDEQRQQLLCDFLPV